MRRLGAVIAAVAVAILPGLTGARAMPPVEPPAEPPLGPPLELDEPDAEDLDVVEGNDDAVEVPGSDAVGPPEALDAPVPAPRSRPPVTHDVPADDYESELGVAPGGYYGHGVILERPPRNGHNQIVVGSILVPLGTIATVTSAVGTWLTVPQHCGERLRGVGIEADEARCQGLFTFNVIRTTYGALMLMSGGTILVLGLLQRERYRKWRLQHGMRARLEPAPAGLRLRF